MEPSKERMEEALQFLSETDTEYARAVSLYDGLKEQLKTVKAYNFLRASESSAAARENAALASHAYAKHLEMVENAQLEMMTLREKRNTAEITIRCWQCLNASRYKGSCI